MKMKKLLAAVLAGVTVLAGAAGLGSVSGVSAAALPDVTIDTFWGAHSGGVEIASAETTITFKSTTYADAKDNWDVPIYVIYSSADGKVGMAGEEGYTDYWIQRSDNFGWIGDANTADVSKLPAGYTYTPAEFADDFDWAAWLAANKAGVDCKLTAKLDGDKAVVTLTNNGVTSTISAKVDTSQKVYVALTGEKCKITNINVSGGAPVSTENQAVSSESQTAPAETDGENKAAATANNAAFGSTVGNIAVKAVKIGDKEVQLNVANGQEEVMKKANDKQKIAISYVFGVSDPQKALINLFKEVVKKTATKVEVVAIADISFPEDLVIPTDGIKLDISVDSSVGVKKGATDFYILHLTKDGVWEYIPTEATADNVLTGTFTSLSPVYIVKAEGAADITTDSPNNVKPLHGKYWFEWFGASSMDGGSYYMYCASAMDDDGYYVTVRVDAAENTDVNGVLQSALKDSHLTGNVLNYLEIRRNSDGYISYTIKKDTLALAKEASNGNATVQAGFGDSKNVGYMEFQISDTSNDLEVNPQIGVSNRAVNELLASSGFAGLNYQVTIPGTGYLPGRTDLYFYRYGESVFGTDRGITTYLYYYNTSKNLLELIPDSCSYSVYYGGLTTSSYCYLHNLYKKGTYVITNAELSASITTGKVEIYTPSAESTDKEIAEGLVEKIKELDKDTTLQVLVPKGKKIEKSVFQAAKEKGVKLTLVSNASSVVFWNFASITNVDVDFDPTVTVDASIEAITKKINALKLPATTKFVQVSFAYDGMLPGEADVVLDLSGTGKFTAGSKVYMYLYDPKDDSFKEEKESVYQEDGTVTFKMTHCSDYIITNEKLASDAATAPTPAPAPSDTKGSALTGDSGAVFVYVLLLLTAAAGTAMIVLKKRNCR